MYRRMRTPRILRELDQLQQDMNRLMDSSPWPRMIQARSFPAINVWTSDEGQVITAEMPGINAEDIDIEVTAELLVLSGERKPDQSEDDLQYHRKERRFGKFSRTIQLPFMVDTNQVDAKINNGILEISLVRAEADKPMKIVAKSG